MKNAAIKSSNVKVLSSNNNYYILLTLHNGTENVYDTLHQLFPVFNIIMELLFTQELTKNGIIRQAGILTTLGLWFFCHPFQNKDWNTGEIVLFCAHPSTGNIHIIIFVHSTYMCESGERLRLLSSISGSIDFSHHIINKLPRSLLGQTLEADLPQH